MRRTKTITRRRGERGFAALFGFIILVWLFYLALIITGVLVAAHFIIKYW